MQVFQCLVTKKRTKNTTTTT